LDDEWWDVLDLFILPPDLAVHRDERLDPFQTGTTPLLERHDPDSPGGGGIAGRAELSGSRGRKLVFTGSSIMAMWETLAEFFPSDEVLNTAVSGSQTHELLGRLDELVISHAPSVVCYYCGSNDINWGVPAATIVENVLETYRRIHTALPQTQFVYLSIILAPQKRERWDVVNDANRQLSRFQAHGYRFIDLNPLFFLPDGSPRMDFYVEDQLHLTPAAYAAMGEKLAGS
jgi:lysophospholipase L1-like esterase